MPFFFLLIIGSWIGKQIVKVTGIKNMGRTTSVIVRGSNALVSDALAAESSVDILSLEFVESCPGPPLEGQGLIGPFI